MWRVVANLYARRVINVNVNILAAGVIALVPVLGIVKAYTAMGLDARWLPAVTFLADVVCDVVIYYVLHFLANHMGRPGRARPPAPAPGERPVGAAATIHVIADASVEHVPFFKDATKVQIQRAILSPLLYGLWLGTQWVLVHHENWHPVPSTALGFCVGVGAARVLHTVWMVWEGQRGKFVGRGAEKASSGRAGAALDPSVRAADGRGPVGEPSAVSAVVTRR